MHAPDLQSRARSPCEAMTALAPSWLFNWSVGKRPNSQRVHVRRVRPASHRITQTRMRSTHRRRRVRRPIRVASRAVTVII